MGLMRNLWDQYENLDRAVTIDQQPVYSLAGGQTREWGVPLAALRSARDKSDLHPTPEADGRIIYILR
jgi:hypothetical protein